MNTKFLTSLVIVALGVISTVLAEPAKERSKEAVKPYKPDTCIVSGENLDGMGKPVVFDYQGQEIKLCCKHCRKDFDKDPAKYLKKLEQK